ncbi:hypothetical protein ACIPT4_01190 [Pectobacterium jejuense]|uniref:hypothetical protein n=1 Tax=Pectobacterium jejuense TaxID=2974022 RepID=UPI00380FE8E0
MATTTTLPAGGRATEAGMAFQAGVGMWFAAHLLARMPVGSRFGLDIEAYPVTLQMETGQGLDDILVTLSNGGCIAVQCKTRPSLSALATSDLGETIAQTVQFVAAAPTTSPAINLQLSAAVMAVTPDAPTTLNALDESCRMFTTGDNWQAVIARVGQAQRNAIEILQQHITISRSTENLPAPTEIDLAQLARLFHIKRFAVTQGDTDWREASNILGARLFGGEECGAAPLASLLTIMRGLIRNGAPSDRDGLLRLLRAAGHEDTKTPHFDEDITTLRQKTQTEIVRLQNHAFLPISGGLQIERTFMPAMKAAADAGSFLLTGEPGAGKTGVLVSFTRERLTTDQTTVFISVDDLAGVATEDALRVALNLQHPLIDVLSAWPGQGRGVLVIDALDASRGGYSEGVFASLIEGLQVRLEEKWSVVASIRSFDLRNGKRFMRAMAGTPPDNTYIDSTVANVRHFQIPLLTEHEMKIVGSNEARIGELLATAPVSVRALLRNVFNLSLAAELLESGTTAVNLAMVTTQSDLIDRYEDERLLSTDLQASVTRAVEVMVERRRLILRKMDVAHPALDDVLAAGVLVANGDRIGFAHHVLFDHAAGRFFLDWNDTAQLVIQLSGTEGIGLLLGPSLRFAIERVWCDDSAGRPHSWGFVSELVATPGIDPVVTSAALRSVAERVAEPEDITSLCSLLMRPEQAGRMGPIFSKIVRFAEMSFGIDYPVPISVCTAWATVAAVAASTQQREYADGIHIILHALVQKANFTDADFLDSFGRAARDLLRISWSGDPQLTFFSNSAIRFVTKSFGSAPAASRFLLQQILQEPRFTEYAHSDAPRLTEGVKYIIPHDPEFAISVYETLFGRSAPSDGDSWIGGSVSRIMPLRSNRRQDYEHGRWNLVQALPEFLRTFPAEATRAVNLATFGMGLSDRQRRAERLVHVIQCDAQLMNIVEDGLSYRDWRGNYDSTVSQDGDVLAVFVSFLVSCQPDEFRQVVITAQQEEVGAASVWARIFGIGAERLGVADDLLWPIASAHGLVQITDLARDCTAYLSSAYATASTDQRTALENRYVENVLATGENEAVRASYCAARLLSILCDELIATVAFRDLKARLEAEGLLTSNRPVITIETTWNPVGDVTESFVRRLGVNVDEVPDRLILDALQALDAASKEVLNVPELGSLARLWAEVSSTIEVIDGLLISAHEATQQAAWGKISIALDCISGAELYDPTSAGHPTLTELLGILDRLVESQHSTPLSNVASTTMVRENLASSFMNLACRFGRTDITLLDRIEVMLDDLEPMVRQQVSGSLNRLWDIDRQRMWALMTKVVHQEVDRCNMAYFVGGPLHSVSNVDVEQAENLLITIINCFPIASESGSEEEKKLAQALGTMVTDLYVYQNRTACFAHFLNWLQNIASASDLFHPGVFKLRDAFFFKYLDRDADIQDRAREVLGKVVAAAARSLPVALSNFNASEEGSHQQAASERDYNLALRLIEHCVNQLYFGSGAYTSNSAKNEAMLKTAAHKRSFLVDYQPILFAIGQSGGPSAIHFLVQLYEYIADGDPAAVFDEVAALLVGPAARGQYHFESLASGVVVQIVRRYLADYREIFEEPARRTALLCVLELFSNAGWPQAFQLLYELPDLMR